MVRAGEGGYLAADFRRLECVAVGWPKVGDLADIASVDEMREAVVKAYPDSALGHVKASGTTLYKFRHVLMRADKVVTYDPSERLYLIGSIAGDYRYQVDLIPDYPNIRSVKWEGQVSRDVLSSSAKNTLGSVMTIFSPSEEVLAELESILANPAAADATPPEVNSPEAEDFEEARQDAEGRAHEFLKDRILRLSADDMEALVAALLRAMGYKARVTPKGPDRGRDVVASPDGFGFQSPRIFAEVKHRKNEPMGAGQIRSFLGGLRDGDCGLYVSIGGYTREARYEADRSNIPLTLLGLEELAALVVEHYEQMDAEGRTLLPLVKVYWPA
jgi:restriction system protein